jgi:uroporphyrinogen decarboxylase
VTQRLLLQAVKNAYKEGRRLVVPLVGFPGLSLTGSTIKLAQQNYREHFTVLKAIEENFKPDAIFPLMDLSVEANALGRLTLFPKKESATVVKDEFTSGDLKIAENISIVSDMRLLGYVETLKLMRSGLPPATMRGAYVTGPYTLAALLMGADEAALATISDPDRLSAVCELASKKIRDYLQLLTTAGAQLICILEPSAVMLGPQQFAEFSVRYVLPIIERCAKAGIVTVYHICGNSMHLVDKMSESGVDALSLDSPEAGVDLPAVAERISPEVLLIGNISPTGSLLNELPSDVENDVLRLLKSMDAYPNFILSTGCDLPQDVPLANIEAFMRAGRRYKITRIEQIGMEQKAEKAK